MDVNDISTFAFLFDVDVLQGRVLLSASLVEEHSPHRHPTLSRRFRARGHAIELKTCDCKEFPIAPIASIAQVLRYPRFSCLLFGGRFWCAIKEVKLKGFIACSVDSVDLVLLRYFCHFLWILFQSRCAHSPGSEISDRCIRRSVAQLCTTFPLASKHHSCHKLCHKLQNFYGILL